jgi:hypothetical protein
MKVFFYPWLELKVKRAQRESIYGRCRDGGVGRGKSWASGRLRPWVRAGTLVDAEVQIFG